MTIDLILRWFYPRTHAMLVQVKGQRVRMARAGRELERAVAEKEEAKRQVCETIAANEMNECQKTDVAREYIAQKKSESGLYEGVGDADSSAEEQS